MRQAACRLLWLRVSGMGNVREGSVRVGVLGDLEGIFRKETVVRWGAVREELSGGNCSGGNLPVTALPYLQCTILQRTILQFTHTASGNSYYMSSDDSTNTIPSGMPWWRLSP